MVKAQKEHESGVFVDTQKSGVSVDGEAQS